MSILTWCNRSIKFNFYLLFGLVPLLLTPWNYELFEYNKMMAVYAITALIVTAWVVKMIAQKEIRIAKTPLDIPIALFLSSQLLSSLFSIDPHVSWFGYYSRFNGGMWSVICYVLLYYAYTTNLSNWSHWTNLLKTSLLTGSLVAIYGVLERLGIDKNLWVQDVQNRVFSTLGQPNWLAAYLVALAPVAMWFTVLSLRVRSDGAAISKHSGIASSKIPRNDMVRFGFWIITSILFFAVLLFTRSRSGLLGFAVADVVFWGGILFGSLRSPKGPRSPKNTIITPVILHVVFATIVFFNGTGTPAIDKWVTLEGLKTNITKTAPHSAEAPRGTAAGQAKEATQVITGPALEVGGTESGVIRKYVWQGAITAWRSTTKTMLIGTGVETFAFAFYQFRPVGHNLTSEWDFLYNKAHNEYLNYLATTGVFGLGSYMLFIGVFIFWFIKKVHGSWFMVHKKNDNDLTMNYELSTINAALFAGWLSILVTNFFGFSVVIVQVFLFLFPAMIFSLWQSNPVSPAGREETNMHSFALRFPMWTVWIPIIGGLWVILNVGRFWYADRLFASGYHDSRAGKVGQAVQELNSAAGLNPAEPLYHDELAGNYATLAAAAFDQKDATLSSQLSTRAVQESVLALTSSPNNVNFWKTRTKVLYTLSAVEPSLNAQAINSLKQGLTLSPNDPKIYYNLAILTGREGEAEQAVTYLLRAKELKKNYRDAYYALNVFYTEMKKTDAARGILKEYLDSVDPKDQQFLDILK